MKPIPIGTVYEETLTVMPENAAKAVGSGSLEVFATPTLCALCEKAACGALAPYLEDGETSVGTSLELSHDAPTPIGMTVTAAASVTSVSGREITFALEAHDEAGVIAQGTHKRFLVDAQRFTQKAQKRKGIKEDGEEAR